MVLESIFLSVVDQELKVEIGLDSGKGSCKVFMSIEENNKNILGTGEMSPPPKKSKKEGKWKNKHKDRGVKKLFVIVICHLSQKHFRDIQQFQDTPESTWDSAL